MNWAMLFLVCSLPGAEAKETWPGVPFTEVRAYAWPADKALDDGSTITLEDDEKLETMKLAEGVLNKEGAKLSADQVKRLLAAEARPYVERAAAGCYDPHNLFVFYNADKKPVAILEVCFDCYNAQSFPEHKGCDPDFGALAAIFAEHKLPIGGFMSAKELQEAWDKLLKLK